MQVAKRRQKLGTSSKNTVGQSRLTILFSIKLSSFHHRWRFSDSLIDHWVQSCCGLVIYHKTMDIIHICSSFTEKNLLIASFVVGFFGKSLSLNSWAVQKFLYFFSNTESHGTTPDLLTNGTYASFFFWWKNAYSFFHLLIQHLNLIVYVRLFHVLYLFFFYISISL